MSNLKFLLIIVLSFIPVYLLLLLNSKNNLKQMHRSRQFLMPAVALVYAIVVIVLLHSAIEWAYSLSKLVSNLLNGWGGRIPFLRVLAAKLKQLIAEKAMPAIMVTLNTMVILAFIIIKRIAITIFDNTFKGDNLLYNHVSKFFYEQKENEEEDVWYVKESTVQARAFLKILAAAATVISFIVYFVSVFLYRAQLLQLPSVPVLGIIIIAEMSYYLDGLTIKEASGTLEGEDDGARGRYNYRAIRKVLRELFGDKLAGEDTTIHSDILNPISAEELIEKYQLDDSREVETYGKYMAAYRLARHKLDPNYMTSGLDLLKEKSILFNNPFYYDLIPYVFYAMNHKLLQHKKVLIILGRHGIEDDIVKWCTVGLRSISNVEGLWRIGKLSDQTKEWDVGIVTRSDVQNLELHKANAGFFYDTEYVVLIEPSKLVTTAQIGLNSIVRYCRHGSNKNITFCSTDKNCDGLVDALSHILMTSISMVSATESHSGSCSYMCWTTDNDYWQHRMLPNISRYIGIGTELSMVALRNQVEKTKWYGGEKFPVVDMHWIAKQYYNDLLTYADLPVSQEMLDDVFKVSDNLWIARREKNAYIVIEDEFNNVFEMKRVFSTRSVNQAFVNIVSSQYLLCDYMTENKGIFNTDPKAIPYIVADYVSTRRNVLLRTCMRMSAGDVWETVLREEMMLVGITGENIVAAFWEHLCRYYYSVADNEKHDTIKVSRLGKEYEFKSDVIKKLMKYNIETGKDEVCYHISDETFPYTVLGSLANAKYIAEEEDKNSYIGTESLGQIFQKYLPGQFFTLNGKYYEMLDVTFDGRILVRRAADHIVSRKNYRQVRDYCISMAVNDSSMGAVKRYNKMEVTRQHADIRVNTPAYWDLPSYQDFEHAQRVEISGIPQREYLNKKILKISFEGSGEDFTDEIRYTITALINEVFRTLFADNQDMIVAVTGGEQRIPLTYALEGAYDDFDEKAIYVIEDSQYDLGLLTAVERNLNRIFQIITDYLQWNEESIRESMENKEDEAEDFTLNNSELAEEENAYQEQHAGEQKGKEKNIFKRIGAWFKNLFKKKDKDKEAKPIAEEIQSEEPEEAEAQVETEATEDAQSEETAQAETQVDTELAADEAQPETEPAVSETQDEAQPEGESATDETQPETESVAEEVPAEAELTSEEQPEVAVQPAPEESQTDSQSTEKPVKEGPANE